MHKDIIYIDTEDDITAIIGKIKDSKEKIIALVPPKRIGALQSAVNLRLLSRAADKCGKKIVLVTNNKALTALSSIAQIPVAKNLQSKPEIAEITAIEIDDGEDIIEGKNLAVGDLVKTIDNTRVDIPDDISDGDIESIDIEESVPVVSSPRRSNSEDNSKKPKVKVPDFSKFRKKLFIGIIAGILLIAGSVWAFVFAPAATIIITANTEKAPVSMTLKLAGTDLTDVTKGTIQSMIKQKTQDISVEFEATGTKDVGDKAKGIITLSNANSDEAINIPAGSTFIKGDYTFVTDAAVDVPGAGVSGGKIVAGSIETAVTAEKAGTGYNLSEGVYYSTISGITAYGSDMTGGTTKMATVVTQDDITKAQEALSKLSTASIKKLLTAEFQNGEFVIADSFTADMAPAVSTPAVDKELASGKAKLTASTVFSITAIAKSELQTYLKQAITKQIDNEKTQKIYSDGVDDIKFSGYVKNSSAPSTVNIATNGYIGPKIDENSIKEQIKGKRFGDVQSLIESINGIESVDINFSYFWVLKVPNNIDKIDIEFNIKNA